MFSAFSFGKIIKTVLPGGLLFAAFVLLAEAIGQLVEQESLLAKFTDRDLLAAFTTGAVLFSLILGFLLNTFIWMTLNKRFRLARDAKLSDTIFPGIRKKLSEELWNQVNRYLEDSGGEPKKKDDPTREHLEYYYLPVVSLDNLNYLWESYFSWYEFQLNTACAFGLLIINGAILLAVMWLEVWGLGWALLSMVIFVLLLLGGVLIWGLKRAALANLTEYEKNLMLLLMGSLLATTRRNAASAEDGTKG